MMEKILTLSKDRKVPLACKTSPRAKRLLLRYSPKLDQFILTLPLKTSEKAVTAFLSSCVPWVEKQLKKRTLPFSIEPGKTCVLYGQEFKCISDPLRRTPALCLATQSFFLPPRYSLSEVYEVFKNLATETLAPFVKEAAGHLGQTVQKVTIRDLSSRWGSCSSRKSISLNWRLILAPRPVAHYVCFHEVSHLIHMNHSKAFWEVVASLCPEYKSHRQWLKKNGVSLMGI